ncbi:hypothetical protein [Dyella sp.]|uniref:hypothetical protein n=1 Tax=Dyella sp. TaxID=1869338 RepID=UPI002FD91DA8
MERLLVLLRPKAPYVEWVRRICEVPDFTVQRAHKQANGYLVPTIHWDIEKAVGYVADNYDLFFDRELTLWNLDSDQWPKPRTLALFHAWFDVEVIEMVADLGDY